MQVGWIFTDLEPEGKGKVAYKRSVVSMGVKNGARPCVNRLLTSMFISPLPSSLSISLLVTFLSSLFFCLSFRPFFLLLSLSLFTDPSYFLFGISFFSFLSFLFSSLLLSFLSSPLLFSSSFPSLLPSGYSHSER